jgi:PHD/YefM family antitoxin component YafN of YafNO toxin-antitoxin module
VGYETLFEIGLDKNVVHLCTQWYAGGFMEAVKVGMREFRDNLATYVEEATGPVALTRHGDTVGYYLPTRRKRTEADKAAFEEAAAKWQAVLDANGIDQDEVDKIVAEFKGKRAERRRAEQTS